MTDDIPTDDRVWYESPGHNHYFLEAERRDDGWYVRRVTPLIHPDEDRGYFRVRSWGRIADGMVEAFHADHERREKPMKWDNARFEKA